MTLGGTTLTTSGVGNIRGFLLKYRYVSCNCQLLQPAFTATGTSSKTFQYSYTCNGPYTSISWDFGDGTAPVTAGSPTHTFAAYGIYPVCVTVTNDCGSNTTCKTLYITPTGVQDISTDNGISVYPNPVTNKLNITGTVPGARLTILDVTGRLLHSRQVQGENETFNLGDLASGVYVIWILDKDGHATSRTFVKR